MSACSRRMVSLCCCLMLVMTSRAQTAARADEGGAKTMKLPNVLYGAAYYNEYTPAALQPERLDRDVALMKQAGFTVVRMGESTWSLWEPEDGRFEYAWMDRVVAAMSKAGIKVVMGTPTYSIPVWMYKAHPEMLARPLGGAYVGYGMRQNIDFDNADFRRYAQRMITNLVAHYRGDPDVIGWQIDNETGANGASNPDVFAEFTEYLKGKFGTTEALNRDWFLNYWGQDVTRWEEMPTRDNATSTSYKLEWTRFQQGRVTNYLNWQAGLVRASRRADQFVTQDFGSMMKPDVNEVEAAKGLDVIADNIYHGWQDHFDGEYQAMQGAFSRSLQHGNYLVTETNAQTLGWDSAGQFPPYDGQLRLDAYTHLASGANMVEYWHWGSIAAGQETYWGGVLGHDLEPNRAYREVSRIGAEFRKIGPELVDLKIRPKVAILYSVDSSNGIAFMPFERGRGEAAWAPGVNSGAYGELVQQLHRSLYRAKVDTDFVFPTTEDLSAYKLVIVPMLYIADDALLQRLSEYVRSGGHVLMTFKSGFANENSAVRWELAPGPLRKAAGFRYQEYSNLEHPLPLKGDPYHVGAEQNQVSAWAEFLQVDTAKPIAIYDHPFFGQWPAITTNQYGAGTLTYEGTAVSDGLQDAMVIEELKRAGLTGSDQGLPAAVQVKHGVNRAGHAIHYYLNYSAEATSFTYVYGAGRNLLDGKALTSGERTTVGPWDLVIAEETAAAPAR